jgi:hypothetical protein
MARAFALLLTLALWLGAAAPAGARRSIGSCRPADQAAQTRIIFIGRADFASGTVRGRIRGRRCRAQGPLGTLACEPVRENLRYCTGPGGGGACTVAGYLWGRTFEGQYDCAGDTGFFCWGYICPTNR